MFNFPWNRQVVGVQCLEVVAAADTRNLKNVKMVSFEGSSLTMRIIFEQKWSIFFGCRVPVKPYDG